MRLFCGFKRTTNMKPTILLYEGGAGIVVKDVIRDFPGKLMQGFVLTTSDFGFGKKQYIIDITSGSDTFDTPKMKEQDIYVVSENKLKTTL